MMMELAAFVLVATLLSGALADPDVFNPIQLLQPRSGAGSDLIQGLDCLSWRLAVETNNLRSWKLIPESCLSYVGNYMLGKQYRHDCRLVADAAIDYASSLKLAGDGKDVWVIDVDETALSNVPFFARSDVQFGAVAYNTTDFVEWLLEGKAPPLPPVLHLYQALESLGIKTIFLTGAAENFRDSRVANLKKAGYKDWEKLILREDVDRGTSAVVYKSKKRTELVNLGYRIVGNIGDQWSDLIGDNVGYRIFKVPNPMYYVV